MPDYILTTQRLGFRKFQPADLPIFAKMNASKEVMEFFPKTLTAEESNALADRINAQYDKRQYTYFAIEKLENQEFIGFIGLALQEYDVPFSPFTDIGWRLKPSAWGQGLATEGAKACLKYGFETIGLKEIHAVATLTNINSEKVMKKIGMNKVGEFDHPKMKGHALERCMLYKIDLLRFQNLGNLEKEK